MACARFPAYNNYMHSQKMILWEGARGSSPLCATSAVGPHLSFSLEVLPFSPGLNSFHIICMGHGFLCTHVHGTWVSSVHIKSGTIGQIGIPYRFHTGFSAGGGGTIFCVSVKCRICPLSPPPLSQNLMRTQ